METNKPIFSSNQQTPDPQITDASEKKFPKWIIVSLIIILFGVTSVFAYKYYQLKQQLVEDQPTLSLTPTPTLTPALSPTSTPTFDPLEGWQIYTNEKYGYSLRYPKNFIVEELPQEICPPAIGGCRTVKEKGNQVKIYNEKSSFIIKIDNEMQYPSIGSTCTEKIGKISKIIIDGDNLYEERSFNTGGFKRIISKYEKRKLGEKEVFCPEIIWLHNNYKITISTYITGASPDDNITIRQILESITFNPKT